MDVSKINNFKTNVAFSSIFDKLHLKKSCENERKTPDYPNDEFEIQTDYNSSKGNDKSALYDANFRVLVDNILLDKNNDTLDGEEFEAHEKNYADKLKKQGYYNLDEVTVKDGVAFSNDTQNALTGIVVCPIKFEGTVQLHYEDGILKKSIKYFNDGRSPEQKTFRQIKKLDGSTITIVKYNKNSKEYTLTTRNNGTKRQCGLLEIDSENRKKIERKRIFPYKDGFLMLDASDCKTKVTFAKDGEQRVIKESSIPFPIKKDERKDKDGYTICYLDHNILNKK